LRGEKTSRKRERERKEPDIIWYVFPTFVGCVAWKIIWEEGEFMSIQRLVVAVKDCENSCNRLIIY